MRTVTIAELEDWERNGAVWRAIELDRGRVVIDMCSCTGERMDRVASEDPELIEYARMHDDPPRAARTIRPSVGSR
jgi:hypothetical protein